MSKRVFGRLLSDKLDDQARKEPLEGFKVSTDVAGFPLGSDLSKAGGIIDFGYRRDSARFGDSRTIKLVVQDNVGRVVATKSFDDTDAETLSIGSSERRR
jgi:hypothetical protein